VVTEVEDCAKTLEDEIKQLIEEEGKQEAKKKDAIEEEEEPDDFETLEVLQQKLQEQARANYLLLAKVRKYDGYIKQLIEMVDRLGARLKHFGLDHYF
jgi:predicted RNase H-like nuclease (RuvC/YqgF family)